MVKRYYAGTLMIVLVAVVLVFSGTAFAAKDVIYPWGATAKVNGISADVDNDLSEGNYGHTSFDESVAPEAEVDVTVTWIIQDNYKESDSAANTTYPRTVNFSADPTTAKITGTSCEVTDIGSECTTKISFTAPTSEANYQVIITAQDPGTPAKNRIEGRTLTITYSVEEKTVVKLETKLTVDHQCFILNQGIGNLTAKLEELKSESPILDAGIDFHINPDLDSDGFATSDEIGTETTDNNGVATLSYNINNIPAGDHTLYAEFDGNDQYYRSNASDNLGISYVFAGFRPPINANGISIFGGRVIPIKIKLIDYNGNPVTDAAPQVFLGSYDTDLGVGEELEQVSSVSAADTDNIMRYSPDEQQYIYNWDASKLANGTYAVVVILDDSSFCRDSNPFTIITVAKKGKK